VVALVGDGAALYGIQALWTAAHHRLPVIFLIANNAQYQILKRSGDMLGLDALTQAGYPAMNLVTPEVDFVGLSRSLGVEGQRVAEPDDLGDQVRAALDRSGPILLDVAIER
jgi:benzoylformate decarboxylase